jgi:UDP-GlcNAc3NAcA epimerase
MIAGIEEIILKEKPDAVILYGDTNSTLSGAIAASKVRVPIVHIEAGLRSFDKNMPEEINRILCDHVSTLLFSPTKTGYNNLLKEGFSKEIHSKPSFNNPNIYHCGDIMLDNTLHFKEIALHDNDYNKRFGEKFILCTIHRNSNTDSKEKLTNIFNSLLQLSKKEKIILPLHPRTRKTMPRMLDENLLQAVTNNKNIEIIPPVSFLEMIYLEAKSKLVLTDSGGVQKEAYYMHKPCIILREQTEWTEITELRTAAIADADEKTIVSSAENFLNNPPKLFPDIFGDGHAAEFICATIAKIF